MGVQTTRWVPAQTATNEVKEGLIITLQDLSKVLGAWAATASLRGDCKPGLTQRIKEQLLPSALLDQMLLWRPKHLHNASKLFLLVLSREDGIACIKLS